MYICLFVKYTETTETYTYLHTLAPHDALPSGSWRATESYMASLAALAALVAAWAEDDAREAALTALPGQLEQAFALDWSPAVAAFRGATNLFVLRSEEHTSELQSLMRISYAVFCLKKKKNTQNHAD